ncbi:MAG TPA: dUTP diphosphatase [Chloroflexota bacterium]|nr:dUTP diphosphatase [Chloroflexota bacterium]
MKVKIKRFDPTLPIPSYQSKGAACVDLYAREEVTIPPGSVGYVFLNVALEIPEGCWVLVAARGSTHRHGLLPVQGVGIGDWDFRGDDDEYRAAFYNFTSEPVTVARGTRIAQMMVMRYEPIEFEEVTHLHPKNRGSYGSTGTGLP